MFSQLNSDGPLNKTAVRELFMDKVFVEEGLKETATNVLDTCLSTGTGKTYSNLNKRVNL